MGLYALCVPGAVFALLDPAFVPALLSFLLPLPAALVTSVMTQRSAAIEVDHQRIVYAGGSASGTRSRSGRSARSRSRIDGLEVVQRSGHRIRVPAPTSGPQLW